MSESRRFAIKRICDQQYLSCFRISENFGDFTENVLDAEIFNSLEKALEHVCQDEFVVELHH